MKNQVLFPNSTRGQANYGWLQARYSFSFANFFDPNRIQFGALRVLNDDIIAPGMGFGTHPHDNMEIITIPLEGDLAHKDSMGHSEIIRQGDVQVMSAGTGVQHSEFNPNRDKQTKLLQIWVFPKTQNVAPRYQQITLPTEEMNNQFLPIVTPFPEGKATWIHQDAWFNMGIFDAGKTTRYDVNLKGNGVYAFVLHGKAEINGNVLAQRDALGLWDGDGFDIHFEEDTKILLIEVPMKY